MFRYLGRTRLSLFFASFVLLAAGCMNEINAQASRQISIARRVETMNRQAKDFERDNMGRDGRVKNDAEAAKKTRQTRLEIEEDLNFLQSAYNASVMALKNAAELRPGFAMETARDVRKAALRLKNNLALPEQDEKQDKLVPPAIPDAERKAFPALCRSIYEFVMNPMFENPAGLDLKNGAKASQDLDAIVRLAEHLLKTP